MSEALRANVVLLFEHEIRAAHRALRECDQVLTSETANEEERMAAVQKALNLSYSALYHEQLGDDDVAIIFTSARDLFGRKRRTAP